MQETGQGPAGKGPAEGADGDTPGGADGDTPEGTAARPMPREIGGPKGPEPTRFGDWERKGIASDF
ncbi:MAG: DUF1674 domain-containing protein [Rhodothalassiaceae bacterium]